MTYFSGSKFFGCFEKHPKVVSGAFWDGFRAREVFGSFEKRTPGPQYNTDHHVVIIRPFMQYHSSTMQLTSTISSENLMQSTLGELGLQSIDVGGAGDCFFGSVSHQLYGNSNHHMRIRTVGVQFMRDNPDRFIESNTETSWLRYLNNMSIQGTWADALILQAVADALKVTIQIVKSNQGFAPLNTVTQFRKEILRVQLL